MHRSTSGTVGDAAPAVGHQPTLLDVGTPLSATTFVVVDLETTGASAREDAITEIGAVKVRGGEVLGELQTLVDPERPVPARIAALTGITTGMVRGAPTIAAALPAFLEFLGSAVLVAHNARFDVGFLRAAADRLGHPWPAVAVVDTVLLARRAVPRDEVGNHRLGTLARHLGSAVVPDHRALTDARATVDVLHALLGRLGPLGITHLEDLATASDPVPESRRRRRGMADGLPEGPGNYQFVGPRGEVLYVGTATCIRRRVRSYFTAAERRRRIGEMLGIAERVVPVPCATVLEARVREVRLIAEMTPRYNRRSREPERRPWLRLTVEPHPRLSVVRGVSPGDPEEPGTAAHIGPFGGQAQAELAMEALHETFPLRRCRTRLPARPGASASSCALQGLGRCPAPCVDLAAAEPHRVTAEQVRRAMREDPSPVVEAVGRRIDRLVERERFEEAAAWRDRLDAFLRTAARARAAERLARQEELVAARRTDGGGWEIAVVRHGRLAGTALTPAGTDPRPAIEAVRATAERPEVPPSPLGTAHPDETRILLAWLDEPGTRLVVAEEGWSCPVRGAEAFDRRDTSPAASALTARTGRPSPRPLAGAVRA